MAFSFFLLHLELLIWLFSLTFWASLFRKCGWCLKNCFVRQYWGKCCILKILKKKKLPRNMKTLTDEKEAIENKRKILKQPNWIRNVFTQTVRTTYIIIYNHLVFNRLMRGYCEREKMSIRDMNFCSEFGLVSFRFVLFYLKNVPSIAQCSKFCGVMFSSRECGNWFFLTC